MRAGALVVALAAAGALIVHALPASADASDEELFQSSAAQLDRGEFAAAIDGFEALSDRGFVHPDASYDRGLAYATRVKSRAGRDGDLGHAAAGFEEVLELRPGDPDAQQALDIVRAEITRRRAKHAKGEILVSPSLDRQVVGLLSVRSWGLLSLVASGLLALALVLRSAAKDGLVHVFGNVVAPASVLVLLGAVPGALWADKLARLRQGVVVVAEAALEDDDGELKKPDRSKKDLVTSVPEGARVEVHERRPGKLKIRWGTNEGWVPHAAVRFLATR